MENELKEMLRRILANQVAIFKRLDDIQQNQQNSMRSMGNESRVKDLDKEAKKYTTHI